MADVLEGDGGEGGQVPGQEGADGQGGTPPAGSPAGTPPPGMVPLTALQQERARYRGREASLSARIKELEAATAKPATPANQSQLEAWRQEKLEQLGLKEFLEDFKSTKAEIAALKDKAERGDRAHAQLSASAERSMTKAHKIAMDACTKDVEAAGFTKDTWEGYVASLMTDEDTAEMIWNPGHMADVVKRAMKILQPRQNLNRANDAVRVANLPRNPGAGGTPPAPPADEPVKGKALHNRAFARLQGRISAEG